MSDKLSTSNVARLLWSLIDFATLPEGRDCCGDEKAHWFVARMVAGFLRNIPNEAWLNGAELVSLGNGWLQIEFCRNYKRLELEFTDDGTIVCRKLHATEGNEEETVFPVFDTAQALANIDWLSS